MEIEKEEWSYLEEIVPDINLFICKLYDIAAQRGTGKFDIHGNIYLESIPLELFCEAVISAVNVKQLKDVTEKIWALYSKDRQGYSINFIKDRIKNIILLYFAVEDFEREENGGRKEYIKIIGQMERKEERRMSYFQALSFYKYIYECDKLSEKFPINDRIELFQARYIDIPYRVNEYLLLKKEIGGKTCNLYSVSDAEIWRREMKEFIDKELGNDRKQRYFEDMELDRIERSMPYLTKEE